MQNVLAASAEIFFGTEGRSLAAKLRARQIPVPGLNQHRISKLRLDIMSMRFQQQTFLRHTEVVYQLVDSSPQLGWNLLGVIEDAVRVPEECTVNLLRRVELDLNSHWRTQIEPLSSLGLGRSGAVKKAVTTANLLLSKVSTEEDLDRLRDQYRGCTTDRGVESSNCDMPLSILPRRSHVVCRPENPDSYLYPKSLGIIDSLHILWGGYEETLKASDGFKDFKDVLHAFTAFASDSMIMRKMVLLCQDDPVSAKNFTTKATIAIDWRWESMSKALDTIIPMWPALKAKFDMNALLQSDSTKGMLTQSKIRDCKQALDQMPQFVILAECYRHVGRIVEQAAGRLEVCDCHQELWQPGRGWKRRRAEMAKALPHAAKPDTCVWMGRRLAWWIAVGYKDFQTSILHATSPCLQELLASLPPIEKGTIASLMASMRTQLSQYYEANCSYLFHGVRFAIGAYHCTQGGSVERSREILTMVLAEVDALVRENRLHQLDRMTRYLFGPNGSLRRQSAMQNVSSPGGKGPEGRREIGECSSFGCNL